ncbi:hypothetical protein LTS18_013759, partial [Coniosporium uncinatum]
MSKGRGLFVTEAVKAGDILLCEKAFSHAHATDSAADNDDSGSKLTVLLNTEPSGGFLAHRPTSSNLSCKSFTVTHHLLPHSPLYHGGYQAVATAAVDGELVVDT